MELSHKHFLIKQRDKGLKKVSQGKMGACLMKEANLVKQCLEGMKAETAMDVSLKCRIGVDEFDTYEFFKSFISTVIESGIKIIFIHARKAYLKGLDPKRNRTLPPPPPPIRRWQYLYGPNATFGTHYLERK